MEARIENKAVARTPGQINDSVRRKFLKMIGAGTALAATGFHSSLLASPGQGRGHGLSVAAAAGRGGGPAVSPWRKDFILNRRFTFMNIGTAGSVPREALRFLNDANTEQARESLNGYGNYQALRARIAPGFGVDADELALSYNTTDGMCSALLGIPWEPGDCVVTTNHEHSGGNVPLQIVSDRYGVGIFRVNLPVGETASNPQSAEDYVELFEATMNEAVSQGYRVRALMWSSPTFLTGTMLPIRELVNLAIDWSYRYVSPVITICDGAHLPGMMAYNYAELGVDFMSGAGHKWQCGPGATGILVVRNVVRPEFNSLPLPEYYPITTSSYATNMARIDGVPGTVPFTDRNAGRFDIGAVMSSIGSRDAPGLNCLGVACDMWDEIGRQTIEDYVIGLSMHLKESIADRWGIEALGAPMSDSRLVSALTPFNPFLRRGGQINEKIFSSSESGNFVNRLEDDYGFIVRNTNVSVPGTPNQYPLRVSTHLWHSRREVDQFVNAAWKLANELS